MSDVRLEDVLAECLQAIAEGRATREQCLGRYPKHAAALAPHLALTARLSRAAAPIPTAAFEVGARRLQQAIVERSAHAGQRRATAFLGALPKGAVVALIALVLSAGAAGASAALGGPNIPAQVLNLGDHVLTAVGLRSEQSGSHGQQDGRGKGAVGGGSNGIPTGAASATPSPNSERGLCQAFVSGGAGPGQAQGQGEGKSGRLDAEAFQRLAQAAKDHDPSNPSIADYCSEILAAGPVGQGATGTATPRPTPPSAPTANPRGPNPGNGGPGGANAPGTGGAGNSAGTPTPGPGPGNGRGERP